MPFFFWENGSARKRADSSSGFQSATRQVALQATAEVKEEISRFPALLNTKMQEQLLTYRQERELKEWIRVGVILHGLDWSRVAHALVLLNVRTLELRPAPEGERVVKGEWYSFQNMPAAILGAPHWKMISGAEKQVVLLGAVYTWG